MRVCQLLDVCTCLLCVLRGVRALEQPNASGLLSLLSTSTPLFFAGLPLWRLLSRDSLPCYISSLLWFLCYTLHGN